MSLLRHNKRLRELWTVCAKHRLDLHLPDSPEFTALKRLIRSNPASIGKGFEPLGVKLAFEQMGTLFLKLGQLLSTRSDLLPPNIISQLSLLQDRVIPFDVAIAKTIIESPKTGFGKPIDELFARFDDKPLAAASIAQVHTGSLIDGREIVIKVVRPDIEHQIVSDFEILRQVGKFISDRSEPARAVHLIDIIEDYRQVILGELDLEVEAKNATKMRNNFLNSPLIYVPEVYLSAKRVMVSERIFGVPISDNETFERLNYDKGQLAEKGLTIFFTQVFEHNFFHADMHPGNIFVETLPNGGAVKNPRYIGLDCAIMGELSEYDRLTVARMLLSVMNENFSALVDIIAEAGWIPPSADRHALIRDMTRTVSPMVSKPMSEIDFAGVLYSILDVARRHQMSIPSKLVLLLKTLVHTEGLGRDLYPELDIWKLAKPILTKWVRTQIDPTKNLQTIIDELPETLLASTQTPRLAFEALQSLAMLGARQDTLIRETQNLRQDLLNQKRYDWLALTAIGLCIFMAVWVWLVVSAYLVPLFVLVAVWIVLWRIMG